MSKSTKISHPITGLKAFGYIPAIAELGTDRAPIYLLEGDHVGGGAGKGYGFGERHIRAAHAKEMRAARCDSVAHYVATLIYEGVPVCSEGGFTSNARVLALRHRGSIVVLEYRQTRKEVYWSVITAFIRGNRLPAAELARIEPARRTVTSEINALADLVNSNDTVPPIDVEKNASVRENVTEPIDAAPTVPNNNVKELGKST